MTSRHPRDHNMHGIHLIFSPNLITQLPWENTWNLVNFDAHIRDRHAF